MMLRYNREEATYNFWFYQVLITNIKEIAYINIFLFQILGYKIDSFFSRKKGLGKNT